MLWWDSFLKSFAAAGPGSLAEVDGSMIFPQETGALTDRYGEPDLDLADYVTRAKTGLLPLEEIPAIAAGGTRGLEQTRKVDFEDWLTDAGLDGVVFPAVADVGPADADPNPVSAKLAWRNGTWVANGNLVPRHLGIPTVTVPMGLMADIAMPVGLTFAGPAYTDAQLLSWAAEFDAMRPRRVVPPRTPRLPGTIWPGVIRASTRGSRSLVRPSLHVTTRVATSGDSDQVRIHISVSVQGPERLQDVRVWLNGESLASHDLGQGRYMASGDAAIADHQRIYSEWSKPSGSLVVVYARDVTGAEAGDFSVVEALPA